MQQQLTPVGELFSQTWTQYKQRALPLLAIILISAAVIGGLCMILAIGGAFGGAVLTHFMGETGVIVILMVLAGIFLLVITVIAIWCQTTLLAMVVDEELGIIEAFQRGWKYLWPMTWVMTILSGILITGFSFGILPGVLFIVWFGFCAFILMDEDRRGLDSLLVSREYVRGYWWSTFGRMILIWLISVLASLIPFISPILSILFTPFFLLFLLGVYRDLKTVTGAVSLEEKARTTIFWWIVTIIGLILPVVALLGLLYALLTGEYRWEMTHAWGNMHGTIL